MVIKMTREQSDKINQLVREQCANCIDDNCLLPDDGEEHTCVQLLCKYGIYCKYLLYNVLPADKSLYNNIISYNKKLKERN